MTSRVPVAGFKALRRDQLRQESEHDAYKQHRKPSEPSCCPDCGAIFRAGRWQWGECPAQAQELLCPACHRIRDHYPAGFVSIGGPFFDAHRDEILGLLEHRAQRERSEHPLARVVEIESDQDDPQGIVLTTTDIHLARDLGAALHDAYRGELEFFYNDAENLLRVHWRR